MLCACSAHGVGSATFAEYQDQQLRELIAGQVSQLLHVMGFFSGCNYTRLCVRRESIGGLATTTAIVACGPTFPAGRLDFFSAGVRSAHGPAKAAR